MSLLEDQAEIMGSNVRTIFDIGTQDGHSTKEYLDRFPSASVFGVEADEANFAATKDMLKDCSRVQLLRVAISESDGTATFHKSVHTGAHSLLPIGKPDYFDGDGHARNAIHRQSS
jgi:FkbM family methyltransferase